MTARPDQVIAAFAAACLGIALYSVMDAVMKAVSIEIGAYNTLVWRLALAVVLTGLLYAFTRPTLPAMTTMRVHFPVFFAELLPLLSGFATAQDAANPRSRSR